MHYASKKNNILFREAVCVFWLLTWPQNVLQISVEPENLQLFGDRNANVIFYHLLFQWSTEKSALTAFSWCPSHQIANHSGYVQVDWKKVEKDVNKAKKRLKKKANKAVPEINTLIEEVKVPVTKFTLFFLPYFSSCNEKRASMAFLSSDPAAPSSAYVS